MGNPSSGCAPVQAPMPLASGSSRHRQSLSISSLPLDKLGRINCEKRTSVSALSSPAKVPLTDKEKLSLASFLGHGHAKHPDLTRRTLLSEEIYLKGIELTTEDRKPISLNPFRGHRRVGSGSVTVPCKPALEYSPRARSRSTASSPKKLDKYAVAKIAASLFHSPTKLERSMSLSRVAHRSASEVVKKVNNGPPLAVGEVILPANLKVSPFLPQKSQFIQSADVVDGDKQSSSDSDLSMDTEEPARTQVSTAPSMQQHIIDITNMLEGEGATEQPVTIAVQDPPPAIEDITSGLPSLHSQVFVNAAEDNTYLIDGENAGPQDVRSSPSSSQNSCMASIETGIQLPSTASPPPLPPQEFGHDSPEFIAAIFEDATVEEDDNNIAVDDNTQLHLFATEKVTEETLREAEVQCSLSSEEYDLTDFVSTDSEDESQPIPLTGSSEEREMNIQAPEWKPKIRKRRRSVSASGIGAMLIKVVRVSDTGPMATRRMSNAGSPELMPFGADALRAARKYVLEKTAQISMGPAQADSASITSANSSPAHACQSESESEDAVKSTYSKFVDIEIGPGGDCVELVQHSKDDQVGTGFGVASTFETRHRNQQATSGPNPRHLHDLESSTCTAHEGTLNEKFDTQTKEATPVSSASPNTPTADDRHGGRPSKGPTSRARINSSDMNSLKECLKTTNLKNGDLDQADTNTSSTNHVAVTTQEKSRTIVSRLQAPSSGTFSRVDVYRPCSVSSLANPTISSSHQDKLWEEQAEIYSSGGRGTPGREDEALTANVIINLRKSPSPGFRINSSADYEVLNYPSGTVSIPWRRSTGVMESSGKKRGRPHTPMRSSLASPESGHFIQQIMSRIRGSNSPRTSHCPKSNAQVGMGKSRSPWSSCICFSVK